MIAKDEVKKYFLCDSRIMLTIAKTTTLVNKANKIHSLTPTTCAVLGRMLTMSVLMGAKLKSPKDNITATITSQGPVSKLITVSKFGCKVKGYINNPLFDCMPKENGKLDVGGAVGTGKLKVITDIGIGNPYCGEIDLVSGEIAEDFAKYYFVSLQQPCAIALGVLVDKNTKCLSSGGFLMEVMPDVTEEDITLMEDIISQLGDISKILKDLSIDEFVEKYFKICGPDCYASIEPKYNCECSKNKIIKVLKNLREQDKKDLFQDDEQVEVLCDFCQKKQVIKKSDLTE